MNQSKFNLNFCFYNISRFSGEFLGFRRVVGSYNENWRWDE